MRESWSSMLRRAEDDVAPSEEFVERLSAELGSVVEATPVTKRSRSSIGVGAAAALVLVLGVAAVLFSLNGPTSTSDLPAASAADPSLPVASADEDMPLSISQACDSFLVAVASILRPGVGQQVLASAPPTGLGSSAAALYELRDQLKDISDLYVLHGEGGPLAGYGFTEAMSELSEAALFVQLGEFDQAEQRLVTTRALIRDLADEPGLVGCLKL